MGRTDEKVRYVWHERPVTDETEVRQVQAILLTRDGRVLVRVKNGEARLSGGHPEPGECSLIVTLKREIMEEAWCEIDRHEYLGYQEAWVRKMIESKQDRGAKKQLEPKQGQVATDPEIQVRMVARVAKILPAQPDPARTERWVYGRRLVPRAEATRVYEKSFGEIGRRLVKLAYETAEAAGWFTEPLSNETEELNAETKS